MSKAIASEPCPECGSKDNVKVFDDGHKHCFSQGCDYHVHGDEPYEAKPKEPLDWTPVEGEIKAINGRKLKVEACAKYGYRVDAEHERHLADYYDADGKLVGQHIRHKEKKRGMPWIGSHNKAVLFGQQLFSPGGRAVYITEGELDALSLYQALGTWPVVSIKSGAAGALEDCKNSYEFLNSFDEIYIAFDADPPGQDAAVEVAELFPPGKCKLFVWPPGCKDASDVLVKHGEAFLSKLRWNAKPYRPDGIIAGADLCIEDLRHTKDAIPGFAIPYPELDVMTRGVRKGTITMLTAGSGIGKSTVASEIGSHLLMHHGLKIGDVRLEEVVNVTALTYMAHYLKVPRHELIDNPNVVSAADYNHAFEQTVANGRWWTYDHFGSLASDSLMSKIQYFATLGVDFVILDHISIMVSGMESHAKEGERKDIDIFMTNLRSLVARTGIGVIGIVHLKRPNSQGKGYNEGRQVSLSDLRGSASLEQISDTVIALERNQQGDDPAVVQLRLLKNRWFGVTGPAGKIKYNLETGMYEPCDADYIEGVFDDTDDTNNEDF